MGITAINAVTARDFEVDITYNPGTPVTVTAKFIQSLGAIGSQGTFVETTPLDTTTSRLYAAGLSEPQEGTMTFFWQNPIDADHTTIQGWAVAKNTVTLLVKNNVLGQQTSVEAALSGFQIFDDPTPGEPITWSINWRAAGEWTAPGPIT